MKAPIPPLSRDKALLRIVELLRSPGFQIRNYLLFKSLKVRRFIEIPGSVEQKHKYEAEVAFWSRDNRQNRRLIKARNKRNANDQRRQRQR